MELLQLKYFVALAHRQHLTNTARELMVTPSAISISLSRLEAELGVRLFDRVGRNIVLNEYGKAYLEHMEAVLNNLEDGGLRIQEMRRCQESNLTIGVWNPQVWQSAIQALHAIHPKMIINQVTFDPVSSSFDPIQRGIELIITSPDSFHDLSWVGAHLFDNEILLAVPPQHRLAGRRSIDLYEARDEQFVSTPLDTFSKRCYELCEEAGFTINAPIKCDYTLRPKIMAAENMLCFITSHGSGTGNYAGARLVAITRPSSIRAQHIYWRKSRYLSETVRAARDFFVDYYRDFKVTLPQWSGEET